MRALDFSLADFFLNDNPNVLQPPKDFLEWAQHEDIQKAFTFFEQPFATAPTNRIVVKDPQTGADRKMINLTSYNYLGLSTHPEVLCAAAAALFKYGLGSSGAPKLSGTLVLHKELAEKLSEFKKKDATMLFSSGVSANIAGIASILRKQDVLILDDKAHQSLVDGGTLSKAKLKFFKHNDANHLESLLKQEPDKRTLVGLEGVYSMDGDLGNLPEIVPVCKRYNAGIYLDEAHSTLMFGKNGRGVAEHFDVEDDIGISYGTFSKSFGAVGGFVSSSHELINYMKCYGTTWAFSCAPSPVIVAGLIKGLEVATRDSSLRDKMWANVKYLREGLLRLNLNLGDSASQVIPIILGAPRPKLFQYTYQLQRRGLFIQAVDYPAVPADKTRFRISVSAQFTKADMDEALNVIGDVLVRGVSD